LVFIQTQTRSASAFSLRFRILNAARRNPKLSPIFALIARERNGRSLDFRLRSSHNSVVAQFRPQKLTAPMPGTGAVDFCEVTNEFRSDWIRSRPERLHLRSPERWSRADPCRRPRPQIRPFGLL